MAATNSTLYVANHHATLTCYVVLIVVQCTVNKMQIKVLKNRCEDTVLTGDHGTIVVAAAVSNLLQRRRSHWS